MSIDRPEEEHAEFFTSQQSNEREQTRREGSRHPIALYVPVAGNPRSKIFQKAGLFTDLVQSRGSGRVESNKGDPNRSVRLLKPPDPARSDPIPLMRFRNLPDPTHGWARGRRRAWVLETVASLCVMADPSRSALGRSIFDRSVRSVGCFSHLEKDSYLCTRCFGAAVYQVYQVYCEGRLITSRLIT